jgi:hypothetical protein
VSTATFDLDVDVIPVSDATRDRAAVRAADARGMEKELTPGTVNTECIGLAKCCICCG